MKDFRELKVWSKAHAFTLQVYALTRSFPRDELYGLPSQLRRLACSVGANIVEGCGRRSDGEFTRFLQIARGSASEVEYHPLLARDLGFLVASEFRRLEGEVAEIQRMLTSLVQRIRPISGRTRELQVTHDQAVVSSQKLAARSLPVVLSLVAKLPFVLASTPTRVTRGKIV